MFYENKITVDLIECHLLYFRRDSNRVRGNEQLDRLKDSLKLQQFLQECDEVKS